MTEIAAWLGNASLADALICLLLLMPFISMRRSRSPSTGKRKNHPASASRKWLADFRNTKGKQDRFARFGRIRKLNPFFWEDILMTCFEERGYKIERTPKTRDGGIDGVVIISGACIAIQAKRYTDHIKRSHVESFDQLIRGSRRFSKGVFIHTGKSSAGVKLIAHQEHIELFSGVDRILSLLDGDPVTVFGKKLKPIKSTFMRSRSK